MIKAQDAWFIGGFLIGGGGWQYIFKVLALGPDTRGEIAAVLFTAGCVIQIATIIWFKHLKKKSGL